MWKGYLNELFEKKQIPKLSGTLSMRSDRFKIYEKNPRLSLNTPEVEDEEVWETKIHNGKCEKVIFVKWIVWKKTNPKFLWYIVDEIWQVQNIWKKS